MKRQSRRRLHKWRLAAVILLALSVPSPAGPQEGDLAEAQRLSGQVLEYFATGRHQEAIPLAQRALAIREKALGPEHPDIAASLNNLAALYQATGAYTKAEPIYEHVLAVTEKSHGRKPPETAYS